MRLVGDYWRLLSMRYALANADAQTLGRTIKFDGAWRIFSAVP